MSYFALKIVAMIFMVIDHVGYMLMGNIPISRILGRIAFPLFAFLLVNGFHYTSNRIKYLIRMLVFAIISDFVFDFVHYGGINFYKQNIFFTLSLGLFGMMVADKVKDILVNKIKSPLYHMIMLIIHMGIMGCLMIGNLIIHGEYGWYGSMMIYLLYLSYGSKFVNKVLMCLAIIFTNFINLIMTNGIVQAFSILSITFILLFRDKKVNVPKNARIFCYVFYPAHLLVIGIIRLFI